MENGFYGYEVLYEGEVKWKEPDYYELHVIYQLEEPAKMTEEETTMEIKEDHKEKRQSGQKTGTFLVSGPHRSYDHSGDRYTWAFHRTDLLVIIKGDPEKTDLKNPQKHI